MLIAHASQHLDVAEPGFAHAVGLAARSGTTVTGIHVAEGLVFREPKLESLAGPSAVGRALAESTLPRASELIERWGLRATVDHRWLTPDAGDDVVDVLLEQLAQIRPDLLVLSTHARSGFARLFAGSVAEGVARNLKLPTLLLPLGAAGIVDIQTGAVNLQRALVVAGSNREAQVELDALSLLSRLARSERCAVELLHVLDGTPPPLPAVPTELSVTARCVPGPLEAAVVECARTSDPCLVVMASRGHDQFSDVLWASHTERVLHAVRCPLLWVPI